MELFAKTTIIFVLSQALLYELAGGQVLSREFDLRPYFFVLSPCNNASGVLPATNRECRQFYSQTNPFLADTIPVNGDLLGSISFEILFTGNYTVVVAGAGGGSGVCSRAAGRGYVIEVTGIPLSRGDRIAARVGQKGTSACDTNPNHPVCRLSPSQPEYAVECERLRQNGSLPDDGGGGGGGFTDVLESSEVLTAGGGGGAPSFAGPSSGRNVSDAKPLSLTNSSTGENGVGSTGLSAGVGGGSETTTSNFVQDGNFMSATGNRDLGGQDCLSSADSAFPDSVGGFGSGGGGCGNGGGGGGFVGGSVAPEGNDHAGFGGGSAMLFSIGQLGRTWFNEGDGLVTVFLEGCECSGNCIPDFDRMLFQCQCPSGTTLSENQRDCITDVVPEFSSFQPPESLTISGQSVTTQLVKLPASLFIYDLKVVFNATSTREFGDTVTDLSDSCVVVLLEGVSIVAASEIARVGQGVTSRLLSRTAESGQFGPFSLSGGADRVRVSAVEVVGITAACQASLFWNVSISTEPAEAVRSVRFQLDGALPQILALCNADNSSCQSLSASPSAIPPPANVVAVATITTAALALATIASLAVVLACVYYRYRKRKIYVTVSNVKSHTARRRPHYENLCNDAELAEPLVHAYENTDSVHVFQYIHEQDRVFDRLKELKPKYGVESQPIGPLEKRGSDSWECSRQDLIFIKKIGEGKFGEIVLMKTKNLHGCLNVPVAVKTLSRSVDALKDSFFGEIELLRKLHHPNILHLFGYCIDTYSGISLEAPPLMILEYMALGDLLNLLIANKPIDGEESKLTCNHLCSFAVDVARALQYLSEMSYVHRDVAARNVLVTQSLTAKLTDFSLAQYTGDSSGRYCQEQGGSLPVRWMAPESLLHGVYSAHTDCWSYGVLVWEMVSYGDFPHGGTGRDGLTKSAEDRNLKLVPPSNCHKVLKSVINDCQSYEPERRPSFKTLADSITAYSSETPHSTFTSL